jgi:hypothetical protein
MHDSELQLVLDRPCIPVVECTIHTQSDNHSYLEATSATQNKYKESRTDHPPPPWLYPTINEQMWIPNRGHCVGCGCMSTFFCVVRPMHGSEENTKMVLKGVREGVQRIKPYSGQGPVAALVNAKMRLPAP